MNFKSQDDLTPEQEEIINYEDSCHVDSIAGSGKTTTIIKKAVKWLKNNKKWKHLAIITFTKRAAEEFFKKMNKETILKSNFFLGTYHAFLMSEIIPFAKKIISNIKNNQIKFLFNNKNLVSFNQGLIKFKETGIIESYLKKDQEKGKEFISDLALWILEKSFICKRFLIAKYDTIYNDEVQDYNISKIKLLDFLISELKIKLVLVGDYFQSIYGFLGAKPEILKEFVEKKKMKLFTLSKNFRCDSSIQDYANNFKNIKNIKKINLENNKVYQVNYNNHNPFFNIKEFLKHEILSKNEELVILTRSISYDQFEWVPKEFQRIKIPEWIEKYEIPNWIKDICEFFITEKLNEIKLIDILKENENYQKIKQNKIKEILRKLKESFNSKEQKIFFKYFCDLYDQLKIEKEIESIQKIIKYIFDKETLVYFNRDKYNHKIMTIHSSKGLEFKNVMILVKDFHYVNNENHENKRLHYVACTRARKKLFVYHSVNNNEQYKDNLKAIGI